MQMRIGDAQVMAQSGATLSVHNPATGGCIDTVPAGDARDVDLAVTAADNALRHWAKMDPSNVGKYFLRLHRRYEYSRSNLQPFSPLNRENHYMKQETKSRDFAVSLNIMLLSGELAEEYTQIQRHMVILS